MYTRGRKLEEEILKSIDSKLDAIIRLLASNSIQDKSKTDAIIELAALGIDVDSIASIVGTNTNVVRVRISEAKKKKATDKKSKTGGS